MLFMLIYKLKINRIYLFYLENEKLYDKVNKQEVLKCSHLPHMQCKMVKLGISDNGT